MNESELAASLGFDVDELRLAFTRFNAIVSTPEADEIKQRRLLERTEIGGVSDIGEVLAQRLVAGGTLIDSIGSAAAIEGIGQGRLRVLVKGLIASEPDQRPRSVASVLGEGLIESDVVNVVRLGASSAIEVMAADPRRTIAVTTELGRLPSERLEFDASSPLLATVLAGPSLASFALDPLTTTLLPLATVEELPFYTPGEQPLACGSDKLIASGEGESAESNGTGTPFDPIKRPFEALTRDGLIAAAQIDALEQALDAMERTSVSCQKGCKLQVDVLFGEAEVKTVTSSAGFIIQAGFKGAEQAYVAWELRARCRVTPVPTGEVNVVDQPQLPLPSSCKGAVSVGIGRAERNATSASGGLSDEALKSLRSRALIRAKLAIRSALENLPLCPQASCPVSTVTVTLGPFKLQRRFIGSVGGTPPTTQYRTVGVAEVPWRVQSSCSEE